MIMNSIRSMLAKVFLNYKIILAVILISLIHVLGCALDKDNNPIMGRVTFLNPDGIVEIELYNWSDHEKLTTGFFGVGASTFMTQQNLKFRVKKIEEDKVFLVILNKKNKIYKPTLETDIITKKPQFPGKPKVIKTVTNLPNKGLLSLNTNILIEGN